MPSDPIIIGIAVLAIVVLAYTASRSLPGRKKNDESNS
jgi:hypothetical protein